MSFDYQIEVFLTPSILFMTIENGNFPNRSPISLAKSCPETQCLCGFQDFDFYSSLQSSACPHNLQNGCVILTSLSPHLSILPTTLPQDGQVQQR